jgi:hypothetical protein
MRLGLHIALAILVAVAGLPHVFCACGCVRPQTAEAAQETSAPSCPHCRPAHSEPTPEKPQPCKCGNCDQILVVPSSPPVTVAAVQPNFQVAVTPEVDGLRVVVSQTRAHCEGTGPPGLSPRPSSALPILLGHLLF